LCAHICTDAAQDALDAVSVHALARVRAAIIARRGDTVVPSSTHYTPLMTKSYKTYMAEMAADHARVDMSVKSAMRKMKKTSRFAVA
jgi:hypothetical protein